MKTFLKICTKIRRLFYSTVTEDYSRGVDHVRTEVALFGCSDRNLDRLYAEIDTTDTRTSFDKGMADELHAVRDRRNHYPCGNY